MSRFLIAAACLNLASSLPAANWIPSSPLIQIGNDTDILFDASVSLEATDNLYSNSVKKSAVNWTVTPGFVLEHGKDAAFTATLTAKHTMVYYNKAEFSDLEDARDAYSGNFRFADGGPLSLTLDTSYRQTARNDELAQQGLAGLIGDNLLRQASYSHSLTAEYRLTEKIRVSLGFTNSYNHYLNPTVITAGGNSNFNTNQLTEVNTKTMPLSLDYQAFDKLSFGVALEHSVSDFSRAPYFSTNVNPAPALTNKQLSKNFYGLTTKGQLTESGKLNGTIKLGYLSYKYDNAAAENTPSFTVSLSHQLTDRITHNLSLSKDVSASSTNGQINSQTYSYSAQYAAAEDLNVTLSVTKSDIKQATTSANTMTYTLGADFKYSPHLSFQAGYNFTDSKTPALVTSNYNSNTLTLSAAFRY